MSTTPSPLTSEGCLKCHAEYLTTEILRDDDLGAYCHAKKCIACGYYSAFGPIRGLTWPIQ